MYEIIITAMGGEGSARLGDGIRIPAPLDDVVKAVTGAGIPKPYIAYSYSFRLEGLNGKITEPQQIGELNAFAGRLSELSEYERVILEGAAEITDCRTIGDCDRILHNLDAFEVMPGAGDYESLGRQFAARNITEVPLHLMDHVNYEQMGKLKYDDGMSAFAEGHLVRDTGQARREIATGTDPLSMYCMKMRICSDARPEGVWIKFPLYEKEAAGILEHSEEIHVALAALGAKSLDECHALECVCQYPGLDRCIEVHGGMPLKDLLWRAQNFSYAEGMLGQKGIESYKTFAAALEYEDCSNLELAADITQNLRCYDFAPDAESSAKQYLARKGVDQMLASCFNLKAVGETLVSQSNARMTSHGFIARNSAKFRYDYYHPTSPKQEQTVKEIRLFCPLQIKADSESTLGEEYGINIW